MSTLPITKLFGVLIGFGVMLSAATLATSSAAFAFEATCVGEICLAKIVIDSNNRVGQVTSIEGAMVTVVSNGTMFKTEAYDLRASVAEFDGIQADTVVIDSQNQTGTAHYVFSDGRVQYSVGRWFGIAKNLCPETAVLGNLKRGQLVIDELNRVGSILRVFRDGRVQYLSDATSFVSSKVSVAIHSLANSDIVANAIVIDSQNRIGQVHVVFEDGRVQYVVSETALIERASLLSPEVNLHEKYVKGRYYATPHFDVGTVAHFFKDGRIHLFSAQGYSLFETILFEEVEQYGEYARTTKVMDPSLLGGTLRAVFSNGTALVQFEIQMPTTARREAVVRPARIADMAPEKLEQEYRHWILLLGQVLKLEDSVAYRQPIGFLCVKSVRFTKFRDGALDLLRAKQEIISDTNLRARVAKALQRGCDLTGQCGA